MLTLQAARQPGSQAARQPGSQLVSYVWSIVPHVRAILNMIACIARASHALSHPVDLACETVHPWNRKNNLCFRRGSYDEHDGCSVPQPLHPRCAYSKERNINLFSRGFLWLLATFAYRRQVANRLAIRDLLEAGGQVPASANRGGERGRINVCYIYIHNFINIYIYIYIHTYTYTYIDGSCPRHRTEGATLSSVKKRIKRAPLWTGIINIIIVIIRRRGITIIITIITI